MVGDGVALLGDSNEELEEISKVLGLLSLNIRGVVRSKDFGKVDRISLDNVEPLVGQGGSLDILDRGESF